MEAIYGMNPVKEALRRPAADWEKIIIAAGKNITAVKEIIAVAESKNIPVEFRKNQSLDQLAGSSRHQGVIGLLKPFQYAELENLIANRQADFENHLIVVLDSIMDPQNLGAIIRTAHCLGANGVVIPADRAAPVTAAVLKSSAGSAQQIPITRVVNLSATLDFLKKNSFWIFGAEARTGTSIEETDFSCNIVLVMGGEANGIRPLVKKKCDYLISIPMSGSFDSLNVAVAAGIIQYEIFRRRRAEKKC